MTRHSKNQTANSVYTYHEKKKDAEQSGYGSKSVRLGRDSLKEFDCCSLTLHPCREPVITPQGYIFDKEAILEYILHQKREIARKMKEYAKQTERLKQDEADRLRKEHLAKVKDFERQEGSIASSRVDPFFREPDAPSVSNMVKGKDKELPSFWIPNRVPADSKKEVIKKPDSKVRCPYSHAVLKLKDLIPVIFTPIKDDDKRKTLASNSARYVCSVTNDVLGNCTPMLVLRTSGHVITQDCFEKLIKADMVDPINGKKMTEKDVIYVQRGASGLAGSGLQLKVEKKGPVMRVA